MFIDETWTKTNMSPLRGWAQKGQRLLGRAPYGHWNTMTFMAALRHDRIDAPFLLDGPINKTSFMAYIEQVLAPTLRPGDVVMADNLGCHKSKEVRAALRAAGARLEHVSPVPSRKGIPPTRRGLLDYSCWQGGQLGWPSHSPRISALV